MNKVINGADAAIHDISNEQHLWWFGLCVFLKIDNALVRKGTSNLLYFKQRGGG
jgi:hypothetical protein